jgi:hypothetical protein
LHVNGAATFDTVYLGSAPLYLKTQGDTNHGLSYDTGIDGIRLFGNQGGLLGSPLANTMRWDRSGTAAFGPGQPN